MKYLLLFGFAVLLNFSVFGRNNVYRTANLNAPQNNIQDSLILVLHIEAAPNAFPKKFSAYITPIVGDRRFETVGLQGEKATGNAQTIATKFGGVMNCFVSQHYDPRENIDLSAAIVQVEIVIYEGPKELEKKTLTLGANGQSSGYYFKDDALPLFIISKLKLYVS